MDLVVVRMRGRPGTRRRAVTGVGAAAACGALVVAACGASAPSPAPARSELAAQYLAIARPANARLGHDIDGLEDPSHLGLRAAAADLRDAAATERLFDRQLLRLRLPRSEETIARLIVTTNTARARLSDQAATSTTRAELERYLARLTAANAHVEDAVRVIRSQLGLPPPQSS